MKMKDLEKNKYWIWLSLVSDLGNRKKQKLLEMNKIQKEVNTKEKDVSFGTYF